MNLAIITSKLVGLEYELGRMDCFSMIINYLILRGETIPDSFQGQTMATYADLFKTDPVRAKEIMLDLMVFLLDEIAVVKAFAGDVLLLELSDYPPFLAIDGGNGVVVAASPTRGVSPIGKNLYTVRRAFRCRKRSL